MASEEPGGPRQRLLTLPASTGESFVVAYTHSLNHFPIRETVTIEQSQSAARHLVVTGQAVRGDGAGIGEVPGETRWAAADDGWHRLTGLHRVVDDGLVLRVGHVAGHRLVHRHRVLALGDLAPGGARLVLAPEEVSPLAWLHGTVMWRLRGAATSGTTGDDRS